MPKTYLGDAVYAETTDFGLCLTTEDGIRATNTIHLEPKVLAALMAYLKASTPANAFNIPEWDIPDTRVTPQASDLDWVAFGHELRHGADKASGGNTPPSMDSAYSFLINNPKCFGYAQWPSDMPDTPPEELQRAYGMVAR